MTDTEPELTLDYLLTVLAEELRSPDGPGSATRAYNQALIEEFRINDGVLAGDLASASFMLLTTTGAKSGKERTIPLAFFEKDGKRYIIASKGGAASHPAWYHNLVANPEVVAEYSGEPITAEAVVLESDEREEVFAYVAARIETFADYQRRTDRPIPVVELRPTMNTV